MRIFFDRAFDGGAWPGCLTTGAPAVAGEAWLGELGLLGVLETGLGLGGLIPTVGERAAALVAELRQRDGFWSTSAENDPLGAARELLRWRDELVLAGWDGTASALPSRLASLADLEAAMQPGVPDRLKAVAQTLPRSDVPLESLGLFETRAHLPLLWRRVIGSLEDRGTVVNECPVIGASNEGDLGAARTGTIRSQRDGSLQLLRSDGPWASAVEVAAWLAEQGVSSPSVGLPETLIVSPSPLLDVELARFGCPVTGASETLGGALLLEVLSLVLSLAWSPADPQDALALLSLPESPVPGGLARRLRHALGEWPAVASPAWDKALADGLAAIPDADRRARIEVRLAAIFRGEASRDSAGISAAALLGRTALVTQWVQGWRRALETGADSDSPAESKRAAGLAERLEQTASLCAAFSRVVELAGLTDWHPAEIRRFLEEARSGMPSSAVRPAEAGLVAVADSAAVVGPVRRIIWWDFSRARAPRPARLPFSASEIAQLDQAGIEFTSPGDAAVQLAQRWRRPLLCAAETLLLVSPRTDELGDESHPHPLWDEVAASTLDSETVSREEFVGGALHVSPRPPLVPVPPSPLVRARRAWPLTDGMLALPSRASQSEIDDLLRCPFRWAVQRAGRVRPPEDIDVGVSARALGKLAHALLEHVLPEAQGEAAKAARLAGDWFDAHAPTHLASLFLPGEEAERARDRQILVDAAATFAGFLKESGLELRATEVEVEGSGLGRTLFGIPDLVLGPRPVVVDAKWSGRTYRTKALSSGTATQLAFYAHLLKQQPGAPTSISAAGAFFVIRDGRIITTEPTLGGVAETVKGADPTETWLALERSFDARKEELAAGQLLATALSDEGLRLKDKNDMETGAGALALSPSCRFCKLDGLCGVAFAEAEG